jgi:hypothetical protein
MQLRRARARAALAELRDNEWADSGVLWVSESRDQEKPVSSSVFSKSIHTLDCRIQARLYADDLMLLRMYPDLQLVRHLGVGKPEELIELNHSLMDSRLRVLTAQMIEDLNVRNLDFFDRILVDYTEESLEICLRLQEFSCDSQWACDLSSVVLIILHAEKYWYSLRGEPVSFSCSNASSSVLKFHGAFFQRESISKIKRVISEVTAIDLEGIEIHRILSNYFSHGSQLLSKDFDVLPVESLTGLDLGYLPLTFSIADPNVFKSEQYLDFDEKDDGSEMVSNESVLKPEVVRALKEIFYTHVPSPVLQDSVKVLTLLGICLDKNSSLFQLASSSMFDKNCLGLIFDFYQQSNAMDLDKFARHIECCGISPSSASGHMDRLNDIIKSHGRPVISASCAEASSFELDLHGFMKFYQQAFEDRPMLSWYDFVAFGFPHNFDMSRDRRIVPIYRTVHSGRYEEFNRADVFRSENSLDEKDAEMDCSKSEELPRWRREFWLTNRVHFTPLSIIEQDRFENMFLCAFRILRTTSRGNLMHSVAKLRSSPHMRAPPVATVYL